jgi:thiol-disulfide isomerase/thioredoxin
MKNLIALVAIFVSASSTLAVAAERTDVLPSQDTSVRVMAFTAKWCEQCQIDKAELQKLREQGVEIVEIDVDRDPTTAEQYNVTHLPTYVVEENGVEVERTGSVNVLGSILIAFLLWLIL